MQNQDGAFSCLISNTNNDYDEMPVPRKKTNVVDAIRNKLTRSSGSERKLKNFLATMQLSETRVSSLRTHVISSLADDVDVSDAQEKLSKSLVKAKQ